MMSDAAGGPEMPDVPEAVVVKKSGRTVQLVWLIPLVAALVGGWLAVKAILDKGPTITITFSTAEGLEAGKTKLKYKDVDVGLVTAVTLTDHGNKVIAKAELVKDATSYLLDDARFWVVRPRISGGTVSGLGTLLSGPYIGVDIGRTGKPRRDFVGLEVPPAISGDVPGREFVLRSDSIGSLDVGAPIYFRRLQAGRISGYDLDKNGKGVTIKVFINEPYDQFVTANTRFWHASGIDVVLDATGVKVQTQSIVSILVGGLAFETPIESAELPRADANTSFELFSSRAAALRNPDQVVMRAVMIFRESVRGLTVGAPVDFRGIVIGEVTQIRADLDEKTKELVLPVEINLYPNRLRAQSVRHAGKPWAATLEQRAALVESMVARGLRAQLRSGSLVSGQLYVALDFFPDAPKAKLIKVDDTIEIPVVRSAMTELQASISQITKKIEEFDLKKIGTDIHETLVKIQGMKFDRIGDDVHRTLQNADRLMERMDGLLAKEGQELLRQARQALESADHAIKPDSPLSQDTRDAMREIGRAAQALRVFLDYLERHPESILSGKKAEPAAKEQASPKGEEKK